MAVSEAQGLEFHARNHIKMSGIVTCTCDLSAEKSETSKSQDSLTSQPTLLSELQDSKRACLGEKLWIPKEQHPYYSLVSMNTHTCVQYVPSYKHTHVERAEERKTLHQFSHLLKKCRGDHMKVVRLQEPLGTKSDVGDISLQSCLYAKPSLSQLGQVASSLVVPFLNRASQTRLPYYASLSKTGALLSQQEETGKLRDKAMQKSWA